VSITKLDILGQSREIASSILIQMSTYQNGFCQEKESSPNLILLKQGHSDLVEGTRCLGVICESVLTVIEFVLVDT
jgi:hypothetical protein